MEKVMNLIYASSLTDLCELNASFDRGVLRIAYTGQNRNRSSISKEVFERCARTMYNCPIVCNYDRETDTLGGHDIDVVRCPDGTLHVINATTPVGCIPESARYWWGEVEEDDGTVHEYLYADALLWKRQEAYRKIRRDGITAQSMEITVKDGETVDGVLNITDFEFTAFALIGVTPCFESAGLEMFSGRDFRDRLAEMMRDLKETYELVDPSQEVDDISQHDHKTEGGEMDLQVKPDTAASRGIDAEAAEFVPDDLSVDETGERSEDTKAPETAETEQAAGDNHETEAANEASETERNELSYDPAEEIRRALAESETIHRDWGDMPRYRYASMDAERNEVYVWDSEDWLLYGFGYTMDGDRVVIDGESRKRMKYAIVPFDEGEQASPFAAVFADLEEKLAAGAALEERYRNASDTIASMEAELGELRLFRADTERAALEGAREAVFARFEDLAGVEAFEDLREHGAEYEDMEALEEKCYAIRGRNGSVAKFSANEAAPKLKVSRSETSEEPYGGIFARYGIEAAE